MTAAERLRQFAPCAWCAGDFEIVSPGHRFCSDACRHRAKNEGRSTSPAYRASVRERCRIWAESHRGVRRRQPWLFGAPVYEPFLPGGGVELFAETPLRWPLEHRNVRGLHGAVTSLLGEDHDPTVPGFALVPWPRGLGWSVYVPRSDLLERIAGTRVEMRIYDQTVRVRVGGAVRVKAPVVTKRGRRKLRIDAITPVCIRGGQGASARVTGANVLSTMCAWLPRRLGVEIGPDDARLMLVGRHAEPTRVALGGKYGTVLGWTGHVDVECNAVAEWLLRCAETIGLGGRVAFGFGRIKVTGESDGEKR